MSILDGFQLKSAFAEDHGVTERTVDRYRNEPNGLPWAKFGGKVYIHIEGGRAWLMRRVRSNNPTREARHEAA